MVKIFKSGLFLFLFISVLNDGLAQKITLGASLRYPVFASLPSFDEKVFLFADDVNSIYAVRPEKGLKPRSLLFPEICGRYLFNDNIFIRYELGYLSYLKTVNINYNSRFHDNLNYEYSFDYSYLTNHFSFSPLFAPRPP